MSISRYKNIIFDLGMVLVEFNPEKYVKTTSYSKEVKETILNDIFYSDEWQKLDKGTITQEEASKIILKKGNLSCEIIDEVFSNVQKVLSPIEENIEIMRDLKQKGHKVYILSNFAKIPFEQFSKKNKFINEFDGGVISYQVKRLKPEKEIYYELVEKYYLNKNDSLFIDDRLENIQAGEAIGIKGIHLEVPTLLRKKINELQ